MALEGACVCWGGFGRSRFLVPGRRDRPVCAIAGDVQPKSAGPAYLRWRVAMFPTSSKTKKQSRTVMFFIWVLHQGDVILGQRASLPYWGARGRYLCSVTKRANTKWVGVFCLTTYVSKNIF